MVAGAPILYVGNLWPARALVRYEVVSRRRQKGHGDTWDYSWSRCNSPFRLLVAACSVDFSVLLSTLTVEQRSGSGASLPANNWTTDQGSNPAPTLASTVTSVAQGTTTYTYNAGNRLTLVTDPDSTVTTNTYDNNGNLTVTNDNGTVTTNTWTYENRLRTVTLATPATTTFTYDGDGLRRQTVTAAGTTNFIWDGQDVLLETDVSNNTQVTYTQTPDIYGNLVSQRRSTTTSFYHHDALGSTLALTDSNENVTDTYKYYAFGGLRTSTGSTVNNLRFVGNLGYYNESALSLQYLRARYYQPGTGRFISVDPIRDGLNWYAYVSNSPVTMVDPSGLKKKPKPCDGDGDGDGDEEECPLTDLTSLGTGWGKKVLTETEPIVKRQQACFGTTGYWCTDVYREAVLKAGYRLYAAMTSDYKSNPRDYDWKCRLPGVGGPNNPWIEKLYFFRRICNIATWMLHNSTWQPKCPNPQPGMFITQRKGSWHFRYGTHSGVIGRVKNGTVNCVVACSGNFGDKVVYESAAALGFVPGKGGIVGCGKLP